MRATHLFGARISWVQPDAVLGFRFVPNHKYWYNKENDHPITGKINKFGWRDKNWKLDKLKNTYRIAVLGDSYVEALQIEQNSTFLSLAEQRLNNKLKNKKVELMNFGRSGFTQTEELLVLKNEILKFSPDMVILFFLPENDIRDINKKTAPDLLRPFYNISENKKLILNTDFSITYQFKIKSLINNFKLHSALISLFCYRLNAYLAQKNINDKKDISVAEASFNKLDKYLSLCTANPDPIYLENYRLNKLLIKNIVENCNQNKIRLILITINTPAYIPEIEGKYKNIDPSFNAEFFEDELKNYAESLNIDYLGLQRIFSSYYKKTGIRLHWNHWNYEGHKLVAQALAGKLSSIISQ